MRGTKRFKITRVNEMLSFMLLRKFEASGAYIEVVGGTVYGIIDNCMYLGIDLKNHN